MKARQSGFTLIELMIVVAIIGILAAVAVPQYQNYTIRAQVTEAITALGVEKTAVTEYYMSESTLPSNVAAYGGNTGAFGDVVSEISWNDTNKHIVATVTGTLASDIGTNQDVAMKADTSGGSLVWNCGPTSSNGLPTKYLPASCRNTD